MADHSGLTISATNPDKGTAVDQIECHYDGEPIEIGLNSRYLKESIAQMYTETLELRLSNNSAPAILVGDTAALFVIMPIMM